LPDTVIRTEGLGKRYRIGAAHTRPRSFREAIVRTATAPLRNIARLGRADWRRSSGSADLIWALQDLSIQVRHGEVLGVIGRNGSGKSTLLKLLSRITNPTTGYAEIRGRVGSLLEVGTGFHPELTGRDNVYLNGSILGLDRASITRRFDEIVAFAEVERFIDTPVKRYSSGMYLRLAFAVAAHLEPEILLVDEVLAVGDASFQRKCLGRMGHAADEGRTVLFVSHNMTALQGLCSRAIWLNEGKLTEEGTPSVVVSHYLQDAAATRPHQIWPDAGMAPGNDRVRLRAARARPADTDPAEPISTRTPVLLEFEYWNLREGAHLSLTLHLTNEDGVLVLAAGPVGGRQWQSRPLPRGLFRDTCLIPGDLLNDGLHRVEVLIFDRDTDLIYRHTDVLVFEVRDTPDLRGGWFGKWKGAVRPILDWTTERLEEPAAAPPSTAS
jgi:lipopolysaccharide transport system ATP-binding protein